MQSQGKELEAVNKRQTEAMKILTGNDEKVKQPLITADDKLNAALGGL